MATIVIVAIYQRLDSDHLIVLYKGDHYKCHIADLTPAGNHKYGIDIRNLQPFNIKLR